MKAPRRATARACMHMQLEHEHDTNLCLQARVSRGLLSLSFALALARARRCRYVCSRAACRGQVATATALEAQRIGIANLRLGETESIVRAKLKELMWSPSQSLWGRL